MADLIKNPNQRCYVYLKNVEILTQRVSLLQEGISKLNLELSSKDDALRELNNNCDQMVWIKMGIVYVQKPRKECMTTLNQDIENAREKLKNMVEEFEKYNRELHELKLKANLVGFHVTKPILAETIKKIQKKFGG